MQKTNRTRGRSAQDPPCPCTQVRSNKKKKKKIRNLTAVYAKNFPWEASPEAFSDVIYDENIGRTNKLSRSCLTTEAGLSYGTGIAFMGPKLYDL